MAYRAVDITFISARELHSVNHLSEIKPYVVAHLKEGSQTHDKKKSREDNGSNPHWNHRMTFVVEEAALLESSLVLEVEIRSKGTFKVRNKEVGHVSFQLRDFVRFTEEGSVVTGKATPRTYDVERNGVLNVSGRIGERTDEPRPQEQGNPNQGRTRTSRVRQGLRTVGTAVGTVMTIVGLAEQADQYND